jgi:uncharacterized protein (TIGR03000 family)
MYSLVLMAALAAPADAPSWGHQSGGCTGYSTSCTGCYGGCYGGGGGYGLFGHRSGCCGGSSNWSCHGCGGCAGSGYGFSGYGPIAYYGFAGCYGSCYGSYANYFSYYSMVPNVHYGYGMPYRTGNAVPMPPPSDLPRGRKTSIAPAAATVIVSMPANAILYANGIKTKQASGERNFVTPVLEPGKVFHYDLTAETIRDGQTVSESRSVEVVAGGTTRVDFANLAAAKPKADPTRVAAARIGD